MLVSTAHHPPDTRVVDTAGLLVDIVVPVYNEESQLEVSVRALRDYLDHQFPFSALVTIVDNGSSDSTPAIASRLAYEMSGVRALHLEIKGRGRALRAAWSTTDASIVAYTDVDLSTSLEALLPLVAPLLSGHSDIAIGSRLVPGARVVRGAKRELISRGYNLFLRAALRNQFSDAQCGFKAIRTDVARRLLPLVDDEAWFFDTELLVVAERSGLRIHEVPVDWVDDPDSRVNIFSTATADLRGVLRLLVTRRPAPQCTGPDTPPENTSMENVLRFAKVGTLSTVAYAIIFFLLRGPLNEYVANTVALVVCTIANATTHRLLASGVPGRYSATSRGIIFGGLAALVTNLLLTTPALLVAEYLAGGTLLAVLFCLAAATALAGVIRFALLSTLTFRASQETKHEETT